MLNVVDTSFTSHKSPMDIKQSVDYVVKSQYLLYNDDKSPLPYDLDKIHLDWLLI